MWEKLAEELSGRGASVVLGLLVGGIVTGVIARWRRHRERRSILAGDARDSVVIQHHLLETVTGEDGVTRPTKLRIRSIGQAELKTVVPNGFLANVLTKRAHTTSPSHSLINMEGPEGSYLLESLTNFVCDRLANGAFEHDLYVMAPCCESPEVTFHQPITILIIDADDLALFEHWQVCREIQVEHGSDGSRVLTLMELAQRFRREQDELRRLRAEGKRTTHVETMYILDLALDKRSADIRTKPVPWERFKTVLSKLGLE